MTAPNTTSVARVSIHGGHSKEFGDANDSTLEEIVRAYIDKGDAIENGDLATVK